ncbi:RTA1 like domain-containing protein [Trichoderma pleuroticola]
MVTITPTPTLLLRATSTVTATCTTAVPDTNGYVPPDACNANYGFYPRWEDNAAFAIAFGLTTCAHLAQAITLKKPFCWVIIMGALWECFCFILRTLGAKDQQNSTYVTLSTLLFLLAPLWINAFAYMVVSRLIYFLHPKQTSLRIPARWLAKGFVTADIISFIVQAAGGALMADQHSTENASLGRKIYMAGVGSQLFFVLIFVVVVTSFYRQVSFDIRTGTLKNRNRWIRHLILVIFLVLVLIVERITFRLIEFSGGVSSSNEILRHEAYQLYLDALPMLLALASLNLVHPGIVLKGPGSSFPSSKTHWWKGRSAAFEPITLQSFDRREHSLAE